MQAVVRIGQLSIRFYRTNNVSRDAFNEKI